MSNPKVSVIVPTLNRAALLKEAVASIFATGYQNLEILVIDDGSTDGTSQILEQLRARHPGVVAHLTHPGGRNLGVSASRNLGLQHATGEFVCFLDSDDLMLPTRFEHAIPYLCDHLEVQGIFESVEIAYPNGTAALHDYFSHLSSSRPSREDIVYSIGVIPSCGILVRRSLFAVSGYFNATKKIGEDYELWLRMSIAGTLASGRVGHAVARVRKHSGNTSGYSAPHVELTVLFDVMRWASRYNTATSIRHAITQKYFALLYYYLSHPAAGQLARAQAIMLMVQSAARFPNVCFSSSFWANLLRVVVGAPATSVPPRTGSASNLPRETNT
jgi:glycosyltransferase involved in cell wall biosynthesis